MKPILLLSLSLFLLSCSTDDTPTQLSECDKLKQEVNKAYDDTINWYLENHPSPDLNYIEQLNNERVQQLSTVCEEYL